MDVLSPVSDGKYYYIIDDKGMNYFYRKKYELHSYVLTRGNMFKGEFKYLLAVSRFLMHHHLLVLCFITVWITSCSVSLSKSYMQADEPKYADNFVQSLFNIEEGFQEQLDNGQVTEDIQNVFHDKGNISLSSGSIISKENNIWYITDQYNSQTYWITHNADYLNIYKSKNTYQTIKQIKVVSFNIEYAQKIQEAITLLKHKDLINADVIMLQEMDEQGVSRIAKELKYSYVYYPSINHPKLDKDLGNAILTKWPIIDSKKVFLPNFSIHPEFDEFKIYKFSKTAVAATIMINNVKIRVYSTHVANMLTLSQKKAQSEVIVSDFLASEVQHCIVAGDFNSLAQAQLEATKEPFVSAGFDWVSENIGWTVGRKQWFLFFIPKEKFTLDLIFALGMKTVRTGKVIDASASDHLPIWADLEIKPAYY